MAEFKFSCPQCGQHIQCDPGYSGVQINCPSCQQAIVVPQAPRSAAAPAAPPVPPPASPGLSTRQTTAAPAAGRRFAGAPAPGAHPPAKPKSKALRNVLVITAAVAVLAGLGAGGWFGFSKYKQHKAAQEAKKGNPAAQVPTPTATAATGALDVLEKVHQAYTNLTSLSAEGTSVSVIDISQLTAADLNPNQTANAKASARRPANIPKAITNTTDVAIKLARPDLYRIEGKVKNVVGRMTNNITIAIWSPGQTNYTLMIYPGMKNFTTVKDRNTAFAMTSQSGGLAMVIPQLFFDETGGMAKLINDWGQTDDDSLNGQDCYTLTGKMLGQKLKIWISKTSCMILQSQITLGGPVSDADISAAFDTFNTSTNQAQIARQKAQAMQQAAMMTKIRGTVTETYDNVQMNVTFSADDFRYPVPRGVRLIPSQF
jgi:outer membrane lipoprotein-sorting protein